MCTIAMMLFNSDQRYTKMTENFTSQLNDLSSNSSDLDHYLTDSITQPQSEHLAKMAVACDPKKALYPEDRNRLLDTGYLDVETGWCILDNGAGFVANMNIYPDITAEMIDWWFAWHPLEGKRYKMWYPPQHSDIHVSEEDKKQLLDESIPIAQRNWGVTHHATEDCNCGMQNVDIHFMSPDEFGFDMTRWHQPNVVTFHGGQGWSTPIITTPDTHPAPALMCHIFRETPNGLEHRTRFWLGYVLEDKKVRSVLPPGIKMPENVVKGLAVHNVCEFSRFKTFLPQIFNEWKKIQTNA